MSSTKSSFLNQEIKYYTKFPARPVSGSTDPFRVNFTKETKMARGTVKWFNSQKGFGFIVPDDGGKDVFVHITALQHGQTLNENQAVTYDLTEERGRVNATNVRAA